MAEQQGQGQATVEPLPTTVKITSDSGTTATDVDASQASITDSIVAKHYNERRDVGLKERTKSPIFYMRNFNNWIKSVCIADALHRLREGDPKGQLTVLDLCCGKGGDLLKWSKGNISHLVCADIAQVSLNQCQERYRELGSRSRNPRDKDTFTAEFYCADLTKELLVDKYASPNIRFDLTSCQFSYHYSFESHSQADRMLYNACANLRTGGYFIGTVPNGCELVRRLKNCEGNHFGNSVYSVRFNNTEEFSLFGCKYDFHLEGVVDCPEFLLYFPLLEEMAKKYDMQLVYCQTFHEFFQEHSSNLENSRLLSRMKSLEQFPADRDVSLNSLVEGDYAHSEKYIEDKSDRRMKLGTLSKSEWEATSLYLVFAFIKVAPTHDPQPFTFEPPS